VGATIDPQLTVSMNDDTLYGYVMKGQSKPFPNGMTFSYTSDRPNVVSVDGAGGVHTLAAGVATITASATYGGVTKSTSFVVDVVSKLSAITVDGRPLTGFDMDRPSYDVIVPDSQTTVPVVAATSADPDAVVSVTQASGVPGTATITSTGADGTAYTYTLNFAHPAKSDEFNGDAPGPQWTWVRQDPTSESESGGALTITPQAGDLNSATNTAKNLLLQPAPGDCTLESKLTFNATPHVNNQQAGIIAYQNDDEYLKLDWEFTGNQAQLVETYEDSSFTPFNPTTPLVTTLASIPASSLPSGSNVSLWLKMVKRGNRYQTYYSTDGSTWTPVYEVGASLSNVKAGIFAYNRAGTSTDLNVAFDYVRFADSAVAQGGVGGTVPAALALSLDGTAATFGAFTPGVAHDYTASTTADVLSTAGDATLSVSDPDTAHPGHLVNGSFVLPSALQASASSPAGTGSPPANVGGASSPTTLLTYAEPVSHDPAAITFTQHIGANDPLRTGTYAKTLTFTLSTIHP
jgi:hypothetical protein